MVVSHNYQEVGKDSYIVQKYCHLEVTIQKQSVPIKAPWLQRQDKKKAPTFLSVTVLCKYKKTSLEKNINIQKSQESYQRVSLFLHNYF